MISIGERPQSNGCELPADFAQRVFDRAGAAPSSGVKTDDQPAFSADSSRGFDSSSSNSLSDSSSQDLLEEFVRYGRQRPFEELVRRYAGMVLNTCFRVGKNKHDAEDATQAVFLTLALQIRQGAQIKALGPWLQQVAKRTSLDMRRSSKRRKNREERHEQERVTRHMDAVSLPASPDLDELKLLLHEELNKLPAKYRMPLILHYFGGMSRDEMAVELGCKASTLGVRIFRGREMLAGRLSGRGLSISASALTLAMGSMIRLAVDQSAIHQTAHAASMLAWGHDGAGLVSAKVIGLTRKAAGAAMVAKMRWSLAGVLLACTTLGAGAGAFGMLPGSELQQILVRQLQRLIQPLLSPMTGGLRVDAGVTKPAVVKPPSSTASLPAVLRISPIPSLSRLQSGTIAVAPAIGSAAAPVSVAIGASQAPFTQPLILPVPAQSGWGSGPTEPAVAKVVKSIDEATDMISTSASPENSSSISTSAVALAFSGVGNAMGSSSLPSNHPAIQASARSGGYLAVDMPQFATVSVPQRTIVPDSVGHVTQTPGEIRGWGRITSGGTLAMNGRVVADGQGIDRTLDLTNFIVADRSNPTATDVHNGWFAENHGMLTMLARPDAAGTHLTWGQAPEDMLLSLVNSVCLEPTAADIGAVANLSPVLVSLLSPDRTDLESLAAIRGVPVGLWSVDQWSNGPSLARVSARYDEMAVSRLGEAELAVNLWVHNNGHWLAADGSNLHVDSMNHVVAGDLGGADMFAVVAPGGTPGGFAMLGVATNELSPAAGSNAVTVPEPTGLMLLAVASKLLLRRRRLPR